MAPLRVYNPDITRNNKIAKGRKIMKNTYKFSPAREGETNIFGSSRPGYSDLEVMDWIKFMRGQNITKICCLLTDSQLNNYSQNLLHRYQQEFGIDNIFWAPVEDFTLSKPDNLKNQILPFLKEAEKLGEKVLVHCSGGIGRTGHILAAWLVSGRGLSNQQAIEAVKKTGRNPYEFAIATVFKGKNPVKAAKELDILLDYCR
jgi:protein-tyrosine phosphatase